MGGYFINALLFLISTIFGFYLFALLLRFLFGLVRADFYNPLSVAVVKLTNPLLLPMRRLIPGYGGWDWAIILALLAVQFLEITILGLVQGRIYGFFGTIIWGIAELCGRTINIFIFSVLIDAILSWIHPGPTPIEHLLYRLNYPLINPIRRRMPSGGLDLSPLVVIILLQLISLLLLTPLQDLGRALALGWA